MIAAAFVFVLTAIAAGAVLKAIDERRLRKHYQASAAGLRGDVAFWAEKYAEARWPRRRSHVSEAREGFATFTTVDELTAGKR
jgi:hypothetical protein